MAQLSELPQWLPHNEQEVEQYFAELQHVLAKRKQTNLERVWDFVVTGTALVETAKKKEKMSLEELEASEAEYKNAKQELEALRSEEVLHREEQRKEMLATLAAKQREVLSCKETLAQLQAAIEQQKVQIAQRTAKCDKKLVALKTVVKLYSKNLCLKLKIDEQSKVITVTFLLPRESGKLDEYDVDLQELGTDMFEVVNTKPEIQHFAVELSRSHDVTKFLCDVRKYFISRQPKMTKKDKRAVHINSQ